MVLEKISKLREGYKEGFPMGEIFLLKYEGWEGLAGWVGWFS